MGSFCLRSWKIRDHAHSGGFLGLLLPSAIVFGRDASRAMPDDLLGGHQVILVDQVADVGTTEIVPT